MNWTSIVGLALGGSVLMTALWVAQVPLQAMAHPAGLLVILGGTLTAVLVSFSSRHIQGAFRRSWQSLFWQEPNLKSHVEDLVDIAHYVRKNGSLSLHPLLPELKQSQPFLHQGLSLMVDNHSAYFIQERLSTEIEVAHRETLDYARVLETAGGYAPTMGLIGALIGLMHTVYSLENVSSLGPGIASAFSSTLLGIALANLFLLPIAGKIKQQARLQWLCQTISLQAILSIQNHEHPLVLEQKLHAFLKGDSESFSLNVAKASLEAELPPAKALAKTPGGRA